jgi:hypothetical protein
MTGWKRRPREDRAVIRQMKETAFPIPTRGKGRKRIPIDRYAVS